MLALEQLIGTLHRLDLIVPNIEIQLRRLLRRDTAIKAGLVESIKDVLTEAKGNGDFVARPQAIALTIAAAIAAKLPL